jgi:hypothetical protein
MGSYIAQKKNIVIGDLKRLFIMIKTILENSVIKETIL